MEHDYYMQLAIEKAREGIMGGQTPFGACVVKDGQVLACEHNMVWALTDITAHAEILAIRNACKVLGSISLAGCTMYATCEPCPMCFAACHWAGTERIVYGAGIEDALRAGFNELVISSDIMREIGCSGIEVVGGVLRKESAALFREWLERGLGGAY